MARSILVVDDEQRVATTTAAILQMHGYHTRSVFSAAEALQVLAEFNPALVITDVVMPGMNGVEMAMLIRAMLPDCAVLLISGNATTQDILQAARRFGHKFDVLAKPVPPRQLVERVCSLLKPNEDIAAAAIA